MVIAIVRLQFLVLGPFIPMSRPKSVYESPGKIVIDDEGKVLAFEHKSLLPRTGEICYIHDHS